MTSETAIHHRRGWCPGVRRPMATGDGLLARIHPLGGVLSAAQTRLLAQAARTHGNGLLDVTARGNLQIRGLREETYPTFLASLETAGLVEPLGDGPFRLTVVSPAAGTDPADLVDTRALANSIEAAAAALPDLPPKICVAVDGGGCMPLDEVGADISLRAVLSFGEIGIALGLSHGSTTRWIGTTSPDRTPEAVLALLRRFAEMRRSGKTNVRRFRDLATELVDNLGSVVGLAPVVPPMYRRAAPRAGIIPLVEGQAALLGALPFGRCHAAQIDTVADWAERFGCGEVRVSFTRGFLIPGLAPERVRALAEEARGAGFILDAADPRLSVLACPGRPACASAFTRVQADAAQIAESARKLLAAGMTVHISGCTKGCAHPRAAALTLVGGSDGLYRTIIGGSAQDPALSSLPLSEIIRRLRDLPESGILAEAFHEPV
jgi:precorrin-3B synthase